MASNFNAMMYPSLCAAIALATDPQEGVFEFGADLWVTEGVACELGLSAAALGDALVWTLESGDLPDGLTFTDNEDGTAKIAGTPTTVASPETLVVRATHPDGGYVRRTISLGVAEAAPEITTTTVADMDPGEAYDSGALSVTGGNTPLVFSLVSTDIGGLAINSSTGALTVAEAPEAGTYEAVVRVTDAFGRTDDQTLAIESSAAETLPSATLLVSDGFGAGSQLWGENFDGAYGASTYNGRWYTANAGGIFTKSGGLAQFPAQNTREYVGATKLSGAAWDFNALADFGLLCVGFTASDAAVPLFLGLDSVAIDSVAHQVFLRLTSGSKPAILRDHGSNTTTEFAAASVVAGTKNYLLRQVKTAGGAGGVTFELWEGTYGAGQTLAQILAGMTKIDTIEVLTADGRSIRDKTSAGSAFVERPAGGPNSGSAATLAGIAWLSFV